MKAILCLFFSFLWIQVIQGHFVDISSVPDLTNTECLSNEETAHIREYNKVEIINNLREYSLADLLSQRGIIPDDNPKFNHFLHCIWQKEHFLTRNNDINYDKLERVVTDAIVKVVGKSGPAMNLSRVHATRIIDECRAIREPNIDHKIAKIQNHIVNRLQPLAKI